MIYPVPVNRPSGANSVRFSFKTAVNVHWLRAADNDVSRVYKDLPSGKSVQLGGSTTLCARNEVGAILLIPAREGGWG